MSEAEKFGRLAEINALRRTSLEMLFKYRGSIKDNPYHVLWDLAKSLKDEADALENRPKPKTAA